MADLMAFLQERIDEDEAAARAAIRDLSGDIDDGVWTSGEHELHEAAVEGVGISVYDEGGHTGEQARHIARWDPARVIAECAAKRGTLAGIRVWGQYARGIVMLPMTLPYADHPDYREEWKP